MKQFTDAGRHCIQTGNLYAGLSLALTMPDICASLEDPGPGKSKKRYVDWCKKWLEPKFTSHYRDGSKKLHLTAENCYQLRCSLVHSGQTSIESDKITDVARFEFFDDTTGSHMGSVGSVKIDGVEMGNFLQLKASNFSMTMFEAADEWDESVSQNRCVQNEKTKLLKIHSKGTSLGGGLVSFS